MRNALYKSTVLSTLAIVGFSSTTTTALAQTAGATPGFNSRVDMYFSVYTIKDGQKLPLSSSVSVIIKAPNGDQLPLSWKSTFSTFDHWLGGQGADQYNQHVNTGFDNQVGPATTTDFVTVTATVGNNTETETANCALEPVEEGSSQTIWDCGSLFFNFYISNPTAQPN